MIRAPRIRAPAKATSEPRLDTIAGSTPSPIVGAASSVAARASSSVFSSRPSSWTAYSFAASTDAPISSVWSSTPRTVAVTTTVITRSNPSTSTPAARLGLNPRRSRLPATGLKITASTAANRRGSAISLTAASAVTTMIVATTTPTKLQAQAPILGKRSAGVVLRWRGLLHGSHVTSIAVRAASRNASESTTSDRRELVRPAFTQSG